MGNLALFKPRNVFIIALLAAIGALGAALVAQFVYGLKPCILCLYARVPYVFIILACIAALASGEKHQKLFLALITAGFFVSFGVAMFHVGVEQHWWELSGGCPVEALDTTKTSEQMLAELLATPLAPCDKVGWSLMGISIVIWNAAFSLMMQDFVLLAFIFGQKRTEQKQPNET